MLLFIGYGLYLKLMKNYSTWPIRCAGRWVAAQNTSNSNSTLFSITVNGKPVYLEIDQNNDGKNDFIVHLEGGVEKYVTSLDKAGHVHDRGVTYQSGGNQYTLFDFGETGVFTQRVWKLPEGKMVKEVFVGNHWVPVVGANNPSSQ